MTARATSPFLILELGRASLTETIMISPRVAYFRRVPPRTLMHPNFLAPELSAASRILRIWIIIDSYGTASFPQATFLLCSPREDLLDTPSFFFAKGARFNQEHFIARTTFVLFVVGFHLFPLPDIFLITRMEDQTIDHHDNGLFHLIAPHHAR